MSSNRISLNICLKKEGVQMWFQRLRRVVHLLSLRKSYTFRTNGGDSWIFCAEKSTETNRLWTGVTSSAFKNSCRFMSTSRGARTQSTSSLKSAFHRLKSFTTRRKNSTRLISLSLMPRSETMRTSRAEERTVKSTTLTRSF